MNAWKAGWVLGVAAIVSGCASAPKPTPPDVHIQLAGTDSDDAGKADVQRVLDGVHMVLAGHIQAAVDGPFDEVVHRYEAAYGHSEETVYSARGLDDALLYAGLAVSNKSAKSSIVLGPAWAMAYWGRGYAY